MFNGKKALHSSSYWKRLQNPDFSLVFLNRSNVAAKYMPCLDVVLSAVNRTRAVPRRGKLEHSLTPGEMTLGSGSDCFLEHDAVSACGES